MDSISDPTGAEEGKFDVKNGAGIADDEDDELQRIDQLYEEIERLIEKVSSERNIDVDYIEELLEIDDEDDLEFKLMEHMIENKMAENEEDCDTNAFKSELQDIKE